MQMNPTRGQPASALLSRLDEAELSQLLTDNSDERLADEYAHAILLAHADSPLTTTGALAEVVSAAFNRFSRRSDGTADDAVRRVFQAIRIAVNDEFGALAALLRTLPMCLAPGGRVAILTFHSGEDRRVKLAFKQGLSEGVYASIADDVVRPSPEERRANPRSAAAKLRFAVRGSQAAGYCGLQY
jgi:16S rRNA (cytosine1402-N4)-methyltransferase